MNSTAAEDAGGLETLTEIRTQFGPAVAEIVEGCSDTFEQPKPDWWTRKRAYLEHLPQANSSTRLVSAADKLHNLSSILRDYQLVGEALWSRFKAGKEGTLWYYRSLIEEFEVRGPAAIAADLKKVMGEIEGLLEPT
jgi:GTP pyrophosphokinase